MTDETKRSDGTTLLPSSFPLAVSSGRAVLIIGDPWLADEDEHAGLAALKRHLLTLVGAEGASYDESITLAEAHGAAQLQDPDATGALVTRCVRMNARMRDTYRRALVGPWERVYDLFGCPLEDLIGDHAGPRVAFVDATQAFELNHENTQVVSLCGISTNPTSMDYTAPTVVGVEPRHLWFKQFCADIATRPVLVVSEGFCSDLWSLLRARTRTTSREAVAPGFFIAPRIAVGDLLRCKNHSLTPVESPTAEVIRKHLAPSLQEVANGHRLLSRIRHDRGARVGAHLLSRLLRDEPSPSWDFLRGHDPGWADIVHGRLVRLSRTKALHRELALADGRRNAVLVRGRVGSGKTGLLMRFAYELHMKGYTVAWVDRSASEKLAAIIGQLNELEPDVVFVDDLDIFGDAAQSFVRRLNRSSRTAVVASVRTTRAWVVGEIEHLPVIDGDSALTDNDLTGLVRQLTEAGLLGELTGIRPASARIERLRAMSRRDLLAALIQVVTGQQFEERIRSEFDQLPETAMDVYAFACFGLSSVYEMTHIPEEDLLQMVCPMPPYGAVVESIESLLTSRLLIRDAYGVRTRHRAIADVVVRGLSKERVGHVLRSMLYFYASRAAGVRDQSHPDRRQMKHLLSHSHMVELKIDIETARSIYNHVQPLLEHDFHYWLQRGAFEVERGDLDLADSYLESARGCEGGSDDYKVITEWALMRLERARTMPTDGNANVRAKSAFDALEQVARREGASSPHTFTVLVKHGVQWLEADSVMGDQQRLGLALRIRELVNLGSSVCPDNREFARAVREMKVRLSELTREAESTPRYPL